MILKNIQYKIVNDYFQLNEKIDSVSFKSFVSDLEKMDIEKQSDTIKQLQKFVYQKTKEINKKKKISSEQNFYDINKHNIEKMKELVTDSYLKKIDKVFNLKRFQNLNFKRKYYNHFNTLSNKSIDNKINNNNNILLDNVLFTWVSKNMRVSLDLKQFYQYTNETIFYFNNINSFFNDFKFFDDNFKELATAKPHTIEQLNDNMKKFNEILDELEISIDAIKYNI